MKKNRIKEQKIFKQSINELLKRLSNLIAIVGSIFSIFVLLMQVRTDNISNFYINNYDKLIDIIAISFIIMLLYQIKIAPRKLYIIISIIDIISIILLNYYSKEYYDIISKRIVWIIFGSVLFFSIIVINWLRLSYSKFTLSQMITYSFVFVITLGSLLLYLPISTTTGSIKFIDSLFTATSAVCVTGLSVLDVSKELTLFGQIVLIFLIQIGGLGIMTISAILLLFAVKGSVQDRVRTLEMFSVQNKDVIKNTVKVIFLSTFIIELIGSVFLFFSMKNDNLTYRIFSAIFHSISSFCNAGFALYTDSLHSFAYNPIIVIVVSLLIIFGGIGYPVLLNIYDIIKNKINGTRHIVESQTIIVLFTSAILLLFGFLFILFNEYYGALNNLSLKDKILVAMFQSISPRTAGFETISYSSMSNVTIGIVIFLMFIGASPSSTGGGVKTTTLFVFVASIITSITNRPFIVVKNRKIKDTAVTRSISIFTLALAISILSAFFFYYIDGHTEMLPVIFETVSAISTVGLTLGLTTQLSFWSKIIIISLMFIGRVGYLTLFMSIGSIGQGKYTYVDLPTCDVTIG